MYVLFVQFSIAYVNDIAVLEQVCILGIEYTVAEKWHAK